MTEQVAADVCVVGAGYAGLTTALRLAQAGRSVVVLEARDRVGGRIWTEHLPGGEADRPRRRVARPAPRRDLRARPRVRRRDVQDLGRGRAPARRRRPGAPLHRPRSRRSARSRSRRSRSRSSASTAWRSSVPIERPWTARARGGVGRSARSPRGSGTAGSRSGVGRDLFEMAVRGLMTGDLDDVSLLHLLHARPRPREPRHALLDRERRQENLVDGGAGVDRPADRAAPGRRRAPRCAGARDRPSASDHVVVAQRCGRACARRTWWSRSRPSSILGIAFDPPLPADRRTLYEQRRRRARRPRRSWSTTSRSGGTTV